MKKDGAEKTRSYFKVVVLLFNFLLFAFFFFLRMWASKPTLMVNLTVSLPYLLVIPFLSFFHSFITFIMFILFYFLHFYLFSS